MKLFFACLLAAVNVYGFLLVAWDARRLSRGMPNKNNRIMFTALLCGSIGVILGLLVYRRKKGKPQLIVVATCILVLELLVFFGARTWYRKQISQPSAVVSAQLQQIRKLDSSDVAGLVSYQDMDPEETDDSAISPAASEAVTLFFKNFRFKVVSETIHGRKAAVTVDIKNIDTRQLARDVCLELTRRTASIDPTVNTRLSTEDYFTILRDTLRSHDYPTATTSAIVQLTRVGKTWAIQADETLRKELTSGFSSWLQDPNILTPDEVLSIYLDEFAAMKGSDWLSYFSIDDIFSTYSTAHAASLDQLYTNKIAAAFGYSIRNVSTNDDTASVDVIITSVDMSSALKLYHSKLMDYAGTADSITSDSSQTADAVASMLIDALSETDTTSQIPITITMKGDGHTWVPQIDDNVTDAFMGGMQQALTTFKTETEAIAEVE